MYSSGGVHAYYTNAANAHTGINIRPPGRQGGGEMPPGRVDGWLAQKVLKGQ